MIPPTPTETSSYQSAVSLSLRDPAGRLFEIGGRLIRVVHRDALPALRSVLGSAVILRLVDEGKIVGTRRLDCEEESECLQAILADLSFSRSEVGCLLEHQRVPFVSYPYEWAPEMLHEAGELTMELAQSVLPEGIGIKDASPYNVLFAGTRPVFVDILSFEERAPTDPIWRASAQFASSFLNPLLVNRTFGLPLDALLFNRREGLLPGDVYPLCSPWRRWAPPFLGLVTLPTLLSAKGRLTDFRRYEPRRASVEKARFILEMLFRRTRRTLKGLRPSPGRTSFWAGYMDQGYPHTPAQLAQKEAFLEKALGAFPSKRLLDVGCNTGHFSRLAAKNGGMVVAIDSDPVAVGRAWKMAAAERLNILPLVVNFASPSPAVGWSNSECRSFLQRGRGYFDSAVMFAVVHHLLVRDGIPLSKIFSLVAELTGGTLITELVGPKDPAFQSLARGRDYGFLTEAYFEAQFSAHFEKIAKEPLDGGQRFLYLLRKRS